MLDATHRNYNFLIIVSLSILIFVLSIFSIIYVACESSTADDGGMQGDASPSLELSESQEVLSPEGIMFLIEYKDTVGLVNFVNEMEKHGVTGLLMVTPEFVEEHCSEIREIIKHNVEIVGCNVEEPFWDVSYEEQKARIKGMVDRIEACTGEPVRIVNSRYFASDMNTVKAAEDLGIPYITARGVTDTKATVFQPEGYNVKILSVSNIPSVQFKYGSLCDYSYFERAGTPENMRAELERALLPLEEKEKERYGPYHRITPVTHTNIGGYLKPWLDMWKSFWAEANINWVTLDQIMANPDWVLPLWQIPINKNAPYTPEKTRPLIPYEDEEKVSNPCAVEELSDGGVEEKPRGGSEVRTEERVIMFHNNQGPMCKDAVEFFEQLDVSVEEHLTSESDFWEELNKWKNLYKQSEGVSPSFGYYPIIFVNDRAFSGFNAEIENEILNEISP
ncbi:MAG: hypothetical protein U9M98_02840 [Patescibacteria group bacterium]|nr:hypothetical protein [Patescibacteria group bacterium]